MATFDSTPAPSTLDDEYETEPLPLPRRRRLPVLTAALTVAVLCGAAFVGGAAAQKHWGSSGSSAGSRNGAAAAAALAARLGGTTTGQTRTGTTGGTGSRAGGAGGFLGGGATIGTVGVIKGSTLYVTDTSGNTVKVVTSPSSTVSKTVDTNVNAIHPGDTVVVRGTTGKNGEITAESISIGTGGFGGRRRDRVRRRERLERRRERIRRQQQQRSPERVRRMRRLSVHEQTVSRAALPFGVAAAAALVAAGVAAAAAPVQGSIAGPVTAVKGKTFTVKTSLSPTGSSKVTVGSKTQITTDAAGKRADLKKGACVTAMGTKKGAVVTAARLTIVPAVGGKCTTGFGGRGGNRVRPPGSGTRAAGRPAGGGQGGGGQGFQRPANFGFAFGAVTAVKGSTVTVKGQQGSTKVTVSAKTQITTTVHVAVSAIKLESCAFVNGTSTDKGVTVTAQDVRLTQPRNGSCTFGGRRGP